MLFVVDLDNTLIYSYKRYQAGICVETKEGKALSYMTPKAYALWQQFKQSAVVVPLTTRSTAQYQRITFDADGQPLPYAITGNGAVLLKNGYIDEHWHAETLRLIGDSQQELQYALSILAEDRAITLAPRLVDEAFVYAKSSQVEKSLQRLGECLDMQRVCLDHNGEKLYVLPQDLNKGMALLRLKKYLHQERSVAAGDSSFDLPMLRAADVAIIPQDSTMIDALHGHPQLLISNRENEQFSEFVLETFARLNEVEK